MQHSTLKLVTLVALVFLTSCKSDKKTEEEVLPLRPVSYQEVQFIGSKSERTFSGTAQTDKIINLSFRNNGIITQFNMKLGQSVKKGQLLSRLDNVQSRLNYENAVSSLNSAESQMNTSKLSLNRVRTLYEKGSASLSNYESAKNAYRTSVASYESAKRSVAIQQEQVQYGYIYAPEDGIIAQVNAEIDENVSLGQIVAVLNAGTDMEISMGLPESVINLVRHGMPVKVGFSSLEGQVFNGVVSEVSPSVNQNTSTFPLRILVTDPSQDIKSGMAANVTFNFEVDDNAKGALIVPAKAIGEDKHGNFVFLVEETEHGKAKVKKQKVVVGNLTSDGFEILKGLVEEQKIAIAGLQSLVDGQEVKMKI